MTRLLIAAALATLALPAFPADDAERVAVLEPYVRQAPPGAMATGAFMTLKNGGTQPVRLVAAESGASRVTEIHTHLNEGGVMKMRQVPDIEVPSGGEAVLQPGGLHLMLIELKSPLREGEMVPITLRFADGSTRKVEAPVRRPAGATGGGGGPMHGMRQH